MFVWLFQAELTYDSAFPPETLSDMVHLTITSYYGRADYHLFESTGTSTYDSLTLVDSIELSTVPGFLD